MKKLLMALLVMLCSVAAVAQNLKVESFRELTTDMTARIDAPLRDQNGEWCALVKVTSNVLNDLEFQSPGLGIVRIEKNTGETWLYIPAGSKTISLFHAFCGTLRGYKYPVKIEKQMVYEMSVIGNTEGANRLDFANVVIKVDGNAEILINGASRGFGTWSGTLTDGDYEIECRLENCTPTKRNIHIVAGRDEVISMARPVPFTGQLHVASTPSSARIILDGEDMGVTTPYTFENIAVGSRKIELLLDNYNTGTHNVSVKRDETVNLDVLFDSKVTINSNPEDATLKINGNDVSHTPYTTYLAPGNYTVTLEKTKYKTVTKPILVDTKPLVKHFALPYEYFRPNYLYASIEGQIGSFPSAGVALGGAIGGYFNNINVELFYQNQLIEHGGYIDVEWTNGKNTEEVPYVPESYMGARFGYGITIANRFRVTPQLGAEVMNVKGEGYDFEKHRCYAVIGVVDARLDIALAKRIAFTIVPEYTFAMGKSKTFKLISDENSKFNDWTNGFNLRFGLTFNLNR